MSTLSELRWNLTEAVYKFNGQPTQAPSIIKIGSVYHMYFATSADGWASGDIYHAVSSSIDGPWSPVGPVVPHGAPGAWDGKWVACPMARFVNNRVWLFYEGNNGFNGAVGLAVSDDGGNTFTKLTVIAPLVDHGPAGSWNGLIVGTPWAIQVGGRWYLYCHGRNNLDPITGHDVLGLYSAPAINGPYDEYIGNPIMGPSPSGWDSSWVGLHSIFPMGNQLAMFYEGNYQPNVTGVQVGLAYNAGDLVTWTKDPANPIFQRDLWSSQSVNQPMVYIEGKHIYVFFCSLPYDGIGRYDAVMTTSSPILPLIGIGAVLVAAIAIGRKK